MPRPAPACRRHASRALATLRALGSSSDCRSRRHRVSPRSSCPSRRRCANPRSNRPLHANAELWPPSTRQTQALTATRVGAARAQDSAAPLGGAVQAQAPTGPDCLPSLLSDPRLRDCVHNVVHTVVGDRTCPIPYMCCILLACEVELVDTERSDLNCTQVRFLS
jgi:hypothetical protein